MTRAEIQDTVQRLLGEIAPEADFARLDPEVNIREQLDIDSMDALNFMISLHRTFGVEIPESDYAKFATLKGCVDTLAGFLASK